MRVISEIAEFIRYNNNNFECKLLNDDKQYVLSPKIKPVEDLRLMKNELS